MKTALVTGCTGQDGQYLVPFLLGKGYRVVGFSPRRSSANNPLPCYPGFTYHPGDVTDPFFVRTMFDRYAPDEAYNLAAMSFVGSSWDQPELVHRVIYNGTLNVLEAARQQQKISAKMCRVYQASSSEMFGSFVDPDGFQRETTPMKPNSPYAVAKLAANELCRVYRDSHGVFVSCGILFNHESPKRSTEFVTRKVTSYVASLVKYFHPDYRVAHPGLLKLGNLQSKRDWGYAKDYVRAMWKMLARDNPDDYVIATGNTWSVQQLIEEAFQAGTDILQNYYLKEKLDWREYVKSDPSLLRPMEVPHLMGDFSKARKVLGWEPEVQFPQLIRMMVEADLA